MSNLKRCRVLACVGAIAVATMGLMYILSLPRKSNPHSSFPPAKVTELQRDCDLLHQTAPTQHMSSEGSPSSETANDSVIPPHAPSALQSHVTSIKTLGTDLAGEATILTTEPVSPRMSRQVAEKFFDAEKRRIAQQGGEPANIGSYRIGHSKTVSDQSDGTLAYVHLLEPSGFIITSANTGIRPVIGFSMTGTFSSQPSRENVLLSLLQTDMRTRLRLLNETTSADDVQSNLAQWRLETIKENDHEE